MLSLSFGLMNSIKLLGPERNEVVRHLRSGKCCRVLRFVQDGDHVELNKYEVMFADGRTEHVYRAGLSKLPPSIIEVHQFERETTLRL